MTNAIKGEPRAGSRTSSMRLPFKSRQVSLLLPLMLSACGIFSGGSGPLPQKEAARLEIVISADPDLNTDTKGRGAPMLLRVFELKSEVAFQEAEFFALQNTAKAVLGADLLAVDQFIIRPGEAREIKRKANPETTAIGIFAGYRDLPNSVWRVVHKMPPAPDVSWYRAVIPSNKAALKIDLQGNAIVMTDKDARTRSTQFANESLKGLDQDSLGAARQQAEAVSKMPDALSQGASKVPELPAADRIFKSPVDGIQKLSSSPR
ncbi:type VI secretion system lipoprotein TssJ [Variovorax boronicumulans]|uniref:type VI secretion system lipoprotein TssJ n=1 Tax=Variovorax boronicumulans TaxID=436515 RepID=UPI001C58E96E